MTVAVDEPSAAVYRHEGERLAEDFVEEVERVGETLRRLGSMEDQKALSSKGLLEKYVDTVIQAQAKRRLENQRATRTSFTPFTGVIASFSTTDDPIWIDERETMKASSNFDSQQPADLGLLMHTKESVEPVEEVALLDSSKAAEKDPEQEDAKKEEENEKSVEDGTTPSRIEEDSELHRIMSTLCRHEACRLDNQDAALAEDKVEAVKQSRMRSAFSWFFKSA